jgi:hypothetical protein
MSDPKNGGSLADMWDAVPVPADPGTAGKPQNLADYWDSVPATPRTGPLKVNSVAPNSPNSKVGQAAAGAALGVADLGNTALNAITYPIGKVFPSVAQWNRTRNADFEALTDANKDSTAFKLGRVGGNVAITAPVGAILGGAARAAGAGNSVVAALTSGGMRVGGATGAGALGLRALGGAATGGASAGLVNPDSAGTGAVVGAALPGALKLSGALGSGVAQGSNALAQRLMQSAIKPTIKQLKTGDAAVAIRTLLDYGISPNEAGVSKLRDLIGNLNDQIADKIANSTAAIKKSDVMHRLADVTDFFGKQVSPSADLATIQRVGEDFANHPIYPGDDLTVQAAQALKQGTYRTLAKKYGQMGGVETEAQKGLARGLKEEIANAVPDVAGLNAEESRLITTLSVAERRALMDLNKNPMGLASLAANPKNWAIFMADRSPAFKAMAARMVNRTGGAAAYVTPALEAGLSNPLLRGAAAQLPGPASQR